MARTPRRSSAHPVFRRRCLRHFCRRARSSIARSGDLRSALLSATPAIATPAIAKFALAALAASALGCPAKLPAGATALDAVDVDGTSELESGDVEAAIASQPTSKSLGIHLWWVDYGLYERATLEKDLERIERYYRARGFYEAHVEAGRVVHTGERSVRVQIILQEGPRVSIGAIEATGFEAVPDTVRERVFSEWKLVAGDPFDEDEYRQSGPIAERILTEEGYAHASVKLGADVDLVTHKATVHVEATPGPRCTFGPVTIKGLDELPEPVVRAILDLRPGREYSTRLMRAARIALFDLSTFDTVEIEPDLRDPKATVIPLTVTLKESKLRTVKLGPGFLIDPLHDEVHVLASWEDRNFLGGLRDMLIDVRPLLMLKPGLFSIDTVRPGFSSDATLRQPSFLESRTTGSVSAMYSILPDPVNDYRTQSLRGSTGIDRRFGPYIYGGLFYRKGFDYPTAYEGGFLPANVLPNGRTSVQIGYFELLGAIDTRDDLLEPRRGYYASLSLQYAMAGSFFLAGDFGDVRVQPEIRLFGPLSKGIVLAFRFMVGFVLPRNYDVKFPSRRTPDAADPSSYTNETANDVPYWRAFFSGGATSNRGYPTRFVGLRDCAPLSGGGYEVGQNCSVVIGGATVWESSLELRFDVVGPLMAVWFLDGSDASRDRFDIRLAYPHLSTGPGLRYKTPIGPVRVDFGWRIPGLQKLGGELDPREEPPQFKFGISGPFALFLSLGEAF
jgi:outer membrane protein insertion porin family/translocation and assembly module TamA